MQVGSRERYLPTPTVGQQRGRNDRWFKMEKNGLPSGRKVGGSSPAPFYSVASSMGKTPSPELLRMVLAVPCMAVGG